MLIAVLAVYSGLLCMSEKDVHAQGHSYEVADDGEEMSLVDNCMETQYELPVLMLHTGIFFHHTHRPTFEVVKLLRNGQTAWGVIQVEEYEV